LLAGLIINKNDVKNIRFLIVNKFALPDVGGVEEVVSQHADFLKDLGEVTILAISKKKNKVTIKEKYGKVTVVRCSSFGTYLSMPISLSFFRELYKLSNKSDFVFFHEPFPLGAIGALSVNQKKKIIVWHSDIVRQKLIKPFVEILQKYNCYKARSVITTSYNMIKSSSVLGKYEKKIKVIPIACGKVEIDAERPKEIEIDNDYYLYFGRMSYYKGLPVLVNAIKNYNGNKRFVIAGPGEIKELLLVYGDKRVNIVNRYIAENEKKWLFENCRALVFPSTEKSEAFGIVQVEAMSYAKPVINTQLSTGVPWVSLDSISGITCKPSSVDELLHAFSVLDDQNNYEKLSVGAYNRYKNLFECDIVKKEMIDFVNKLLK